MEGKWQALTGNNREGWRDFLKGERVRAC